METEERSFATCAYCLLIRVLDDNKVCVRSMCYVRRARVMYGGFEYLRFVIDHFHLKVNCKIVNEMLNKSKSYIWNYKWR